MLGTVNTFSNVDFFLALIPAVIILTGADNGDGHYIGERLSYPRYFFKYRFTFPVVHPKYQTRYGQWTFEYILYKKEIFKYYRVLNIYGENYGNHDRFRGR